MSDTEKKQAYEKPMSIVEATQLLAKKGFGVRRPEADDIMFGGRDLLENRHPAAHPLVRFMNERGYTVFAMSEDDKAAHAVQLDPALTEAQMREQIREAGILPNIGKLDASKITIKDEAEPALFTFEDGPHSVTIRASGITIKADSSWHQQALLDAANKLAPLILERAEREAERADYCARYGDEPDAASPVISLQDAVTAIREAIEDGDDATVDAAGDAIAELVRFIGQADDAEAEPATEPFKWFAGKYNNRRSTMPDDPELAQAIAHERKRAQAEEAEREAEAHSGVAEGLAAAGSLGWPTGHSAQLKNVQVNARQFGKTAMMTDMLEQAASQPELRIGVDLASGPGKTLWTCCGINADTMAKAVDKAMRKGKALVRLTYGHGDGMQAKLVEAVGEVPSPVTDAHDFKSNTHRSINAETGRITETTTAVHSYTLRR